MSRRLIACVASIDILDTVGIIALQLTFLTATGKQRPKVHCYLRSDHTPSLDGIRAIIVLTFYS
jgi:hypothetical protein